jgi:hypothetical protein
MTVLHIDGYKITVYESFNGNSMYIQDALGVQVYKAKFSGRPAAHFHFLKSIHAF